MKKYNILLSLNKKKNKLNELVLKKKLSSKVIIHLSQEIDELQKDSKISLTIGNIMYLVFIITY